MTARDRALDLLRAFTGDRYAFGHGVLPQAGRLASGLGKRALVFANEGGWHAELAAAVLASFRQAGIEPVGGRAFPAARPNAPREDVYRMEALIAHARPDFVAAIGGGSVIDAAKAACALASLGLACPAVDPLFGMGKVTERIAGTGVTLIPLLAIQTAAGSAAHLTQYSNITDPAAGQKKLIIDEAIVPARALFDFDTLRTAPPALLADGILDGIAHSLEVYLGAPAAKRETVDPACLTGLDLLMTHGAKAAHDRSPEALEAVGLGTDLGGLAIMLGGTNGPHLNSFSFVDVVSHGRACGLLNPYYVVLFAEAVASLLVPVLELLARAGYAKADDTRLGGRDLGLAVARGLTVLAEGLGAPTALSQLEGFTPAHIRRALAAAKDPALASKLQNMPVPMTAADVEAHMGPLLQAAYEGKLELVPSLKSAGN